MEIRVNGRRISSWIVPVRASGEPCCRATAPCCRSDDAACPCEIQILMEKKEAYPPECTRWERGWHCELGTTPLEPVAASEDDRCPAPEEDAAGGEASFRP